MKVGLAKGLILVGFLLHLFSSCREYYFIGPQPIDRKNTYHFPRAFRGSWEGREDSTTISFSSERSLDSLKPEISSALDTMGIVHKDSTQEQKDSISSFYFTIDSERDTPFQFVDSASYAASQRWLSLKNNDLNTGSITIRRKFLRIIMINDERVDKRSILIAGTKEEQELRAYNSECHKADSATKPEASKASYYLKGDWIFEMKKGNLGKAYSYDSSGHETMIHQVDTYTRELGRDAFFRKLNKRFWVFNALSSNPENSGWWTIQILEKTKHRTMRSWDCGTKLETHPSMFYSFGNDYPDFYFDCGWTAAEMLHLIKDGYFDASDTWYRVK